MRTLLSAPPSGRVLRQPKHTFLTEQLPFAITPFFIAPVLPAETLQNLYFEARSVSDPVKNKLIGWSMEYRFFYVRITDLLNDAIRDMFINPANTDLRATYGIPSNQKGFYAAKGGMDYMQLAYKRVVDTYFRDAGETNANFKTSDGVYCYAQFKDKYWLDSITDSDDLPEGLDPGTVSTAEDLEALMLAWEQLRALGIADMTYEDFIRSYGLSIPKKDENKPELIAQFTDWQYPSNTVNPSNGAPSSALSWVFKNSNRDPKLFKEPGFIIGVSVARPKIYYGGLAGSLTGFLSRAWDWLPNYMNEASSDPAPMTSLKKFLTDTGPLGDRTAAVEEYFVDMRDLFMHGDQFQNVKAFADPPVDDGANNLFAQPGTTVSGNAWRYPSNASSDAQVKSLFTTPASAFYVRSDGMVSLSVKGRQVDYTVGNFAEI